MKKSGILIPTNQESVSGWLYMELKFMMIYTRFGEKNDLIPVEPIQGI